MSINRHLEMLTSMRCMLVFAAMAVPVAAQETAADTVKERHSGVPFPIRLTPPGGATPHLLMGTAIREKTIFRVKIYAFGLYVDPEGARANLTAFAGVPASELARDKSFYRRILDMDFAMTLRLVMTRDVAGDAVADAFDSALRPRVQRAAAETNMSGGAAALERFRRYFNLHEVTKGTEIVFSCGPAGRFETLVRGASRPGIESRALCWALFDVYIGEQPISADGKKSVVAGFPELLLRGMR